MNSTNNIAARAAYDNARKMFWKAFRDKFADGPKGDQDCTDFVNSLKLSQSEIRSEVQLTTGSTTFNFGITTGQNSQGASGLFNTEAPFRLNMQDSLCVNEYAVFVAKPSSATDTTFTLDTYGNASKYSTANVAAAINGTLYGSGALKITCNNDILVPGRGLYNHFYVPQTQNAVGVTAQTVFPIDQKRGAEDGFITTEPNIVLIGAKNTVPQIVLPAALAAVETFQRAVIVFRGILAQNSTVVS